MSWEVRFDETFDPEFDATFARPKEERTKK
jgi:hypothetical protein